MKKRSISLLLLTIILLLLVGCATSKPGELSKDITPERIGTGKNTFTLRICHGDGKERLLEVHTDTETVGDALLGLQLIAGDEGPYGLYVLTVDGETLPKSGKRYWAFYTDGAYATTGVDSAAIEKDTLYELRAEKA